MVGPADRTRARRRRSPSRSTCELRRRRAPRHPLQPRRRRLAGLHAQVRRPLAAGRPGRRRVDVARARGGAARVHRARRRARAGRCAAPSTSSSTRRCSSALHRAARAGAEVALAISCPSSAGWPDYPAAQNIDAIRALAGKRGAYKGLSAFVTPRSHAKAIAHNKFLVLLEGRRAARRLDGVDQRHARARSTGSRTSATSSGIPASRRSSSATGSSCTPTSRPRRWSRSPRRTPTIQDAGTSALLSPRATLKALDGYAGPHPRRAAVGVHHRPVRPRRPDLRGARRAERQAPLRAARVRGRRPDADPARRPGQPGRRRRLPGRARRLAPVPARAAHRPQRARQVHPHQVPARSTR